MREEHEKLKRLWQDYTLRFQGVDQALERAFGLLDEGIRRYTEQVQAFHSEMDQHLSRAIESIAAAVGELDGRLEDLADTLAYARE